MFDVLYEFHCLVGLPRRATVNEHARMLQLERFLAPWPTTQEGRRWRRLGLKESGTIVRVLGAHRTVVIDASVSGLRIAGGFGLEAGEYVELRAGRFVFPCRVVWRDARAEQAGLALCDRPRPLEAVVAA